MKKVETVGGAHLLDKNFWNRDLPTRAIEVVLIPNRDIWENHRGRKKKKLFSKGKLYKGIRVEYRFGSGYGWKNLDHWALKDNFGDGRKIVTRTLFKEKSIRENALDELGI
jgi:hypothetical protein